MKNTTFLPTRPATPEDVLEILRDNLGHFSRINFNGEPSLTLDFETSLVDWADEYEMATDIDSLGAAMNEFFELGIDPGEWRRALDPVKTSTLRPLCKTVARHLHLPAVEPEGYLGASCREAGAFFALRALLRRSGIQVTGLHPSTPLSAVARDHFNEILDSTARLAPGLLPSPVLVPSKPRLDAIYRTMGNIGGYAFVFGVLPLALISIGVSSLVVVGGISGWFDIHTFVESFIESVFAWIVVLGITGIGVGGFMAMGLRSRISVASATFKGFETFGDLARVVAAYEPPPSSA